MPKDRSTVQINLRLTPGELKAIDDVRLKGVARTWWIRGAIHRRLGWPTEEVPVASGIAVLADKRMPPETVAIVPPAHREGCECFLCKATA